MLPTPTTSSVDFNRVYEPAEDSFLLLDLLEQELSFITDNTSSSSTATPIVLEIGSGSGIVTTFMHKSILPNGFYLTTDLNLHACEASLDTWAQNEGKVGRLDAIRASLATALRPNTVDYLIFNPPYVPDEIVPEQPNDDDDESWLDLALLGGADGMEVTWLVLDSLDDILATPRGVAYILFCKRNKPESVAKTMVGRGWNAELLGERKAGWEVLSVWKFSRKQ